MNNSEMFKINYDGKSIYIPKSTVEFQDGYAVVEKDITTTTKNGMWYDLNLTLRGVIDENFNTVLDFKGYNVDIQAFPEGNFIVKVRFSHGDGEQTHSFYEYHHYRITGKSAEKFAELKVAEYFIVNETTIKIKRYNSRKSIEALYDVVQGKTVSDAFTIIGQFKPQNENENVKLAKAVKKLLCNDLSDNVCDIVCYIDESGAIRSSLYNSYSNSMIETTTEYFDFSKTIEEIQKQVLEDTMKKSEVANQLAKTIIIPK